MIGNGSLLTCDNLYLLKTISAYNESFNVESCGTKHKIELNDLSNMILDFIDFIINLMLV